MKQINKSATRLLVFAVLSVCLFVGGIPMIIIGAANKMTAVMVLGIVFTAFDFYACPILFSIYGGVNTLKKVVKAVEIDRIYDVKNIAVQTGLNEEIVKADILKCIEKGYITGLLFDGETLRFNDNRKAERRRLRTKCLSCGAPIDYYADESPVCPYCGASADKR